MNARGWMLTSFVALMSCAPRFAPGPKAVEEAAKPVEVVSGPVATGDIVYLEAVVAAGSARDPLGNEGLAALTAHSMIDGGAGERDPQQVRDALYPTGGRFSMVVDREWVSIRLKCHIDHATLCVELFADVLTAPQFEADEVTRASEQADYWLTKGVLADEEALGMEVFDNWLFEGHPYGHPVDGRSGVLPLLGPEQLRAFHRAHYVREAITVGVAGDYDDALVTDLVTRLQLLPATRSPELALQQPISVQGRSLLAVQTDTPVAGFHFGHPVKLTRSDDDFVAMYLAMTAFGAHRQSFGRLFQRLRGARGLNYGDYAYIEPFSQRGWSSLPEQGVVRRQPYFYVWLRPTSVENGPFALKMALMEVEELVANGLTEDEFTNTLAYLKGYGSMIAQNPGRRLSYQLESVASGTPDLLGILSSLNGLTLEEVNAAIARHVEPANLRIVAVTGDPDSVIRGVTGGEPTPIVYSDVEPDEAQAARDDEVASYDAAVSADNASVTSAEGLFR